MRKRIMTLLAMLVCFNVSMPVHAIQMGTEQKPAQAAITKALKMGEGVETPNLTFSFEFTSVSVDNITATDQNMPVIGEKTIKFSASDNGETIDGVKTVHKESESLFDGITWPHAGVYVYTISEKQSVKENLSTQESITFSPAKYTVTVYVANGAKGPYVAAIGTVITVTEGQPGVNPNDKVEGTPGGDPAIDGDYSKMIFTNTYMKNNTTGNPKDYTLAISKEVKTADSPEYDFANRTMYFDFNITVTKSSVNANDTQKYKVFIMEGDDVVTDKNNYNGTILTDTTYGNYFLLTTGEEATVHLAHGQWMSFIDLELGSSYTVTELAKANFTPSCIQVINGKSNQHQGTVNTSLSIPKETITAGDDRADFVNTLNKVTPVGIKVDNLPYIILLSIGLCSLILYILIKSRKEEKE